MDKRFFGSEYEFLTNKFSPQKHLPYWIITHQLAYFSTEKTM